MSGAEVIGQLTADDYADLALRLRRMRAAAEPEPEAEAEQEPGDAA